MEFQDLSTYVEILKKLPFTTKYYNLPNYQEKRERNSFVSKDTRNSSNVNSCKIESRFKFKEKYVTEVSIFLMW